MVLWPSGIFANQSSQLEDTKDILAMVWENHSMESFLSVWKVQHHDSYPSFVLSCAIDGTMLLWDLQPKGRADDLPQSPAIAELFNVGLSINSFDIELETNTLICCSDNESLSLEVLNLYWGWSIEKQ